VQTGTTLTGPFGEPISGQTNPNNTATGSTYGWVGQNEKDTETSFALAPTQMGARVYIPELGRFTAVDLVQGGTANNYTYPNDPVNDFDLGGTMSKNHSQSGRGYKTPSEKQWDAYYKSKASKKYDRGDLRAWEKIKKENEKYQGQRNRQKRNKDDDHNNPTAPPSIGPNPYLGGAGGSNNAAKAVVVGGGAAAGGAILWWSLKLASPVCGPALPVCVVAF